MIAERSSNVCAACCTSTNNVTENFTAYPADEAEQMRSHWRGILVEMSIADAMAGGQLNATADDLLEALRNASRSAHAVPRTHGRLPVGVSGVVRLTRPATTWHSLTGCSGGRGWTARLDQAIEQFTLEGLLALAISGGMLLGCCSCLCLLCLLLLRCKLSGSLSSGKCAFVGLFLRLLLLGLLLR